MNALKFALALLLLPFWMACGGGEADRTPEPPVEITDSPAAMPSQYEMARVGHAVAMARAIQERPGEVDAILAEHEMTREEFETLLYDIAADPAMSRLYAEQMGN